MLRLNEVNKILDYISKDMFKTVLLIIDKPKFRRWRTALANFHVSLSKSNQIQ